jgi:hypothetical protein
MLTKNCLIISPSPTQRVAARLVKDRETGSLAWCTLRRPGNHFTWYLQNRVPSSEESCGWCESAEAKVPSVPSHFSWKTSTSRSSRNRHPRYTWCFQDASGGIVHIIEGVAFLGDPRVFSWRLSWYIGKFGKVTLVLVKNSTSWNSEPHNFLRFNQS